MGTINRGKQFEERVKIDLLKLPDISLERFPDQMSGYSGSKNVCDFGAYLFPYYYYIECKTTHENTFPLSGLTQYDKLMERKGRKGVRSGVLIWFIKWDTIVYVPVATFEKIKQDGLKSVNIKMLDKDTYRIIRIPTTKLRVFLECDFSVLHDLEEGD